MEPQNESTWESLARLIPGYGAYRSEERRRDDDRLTRQFLIRRLQECKLQLERLGAGAVAAGDLKTPAIIDRCTGDIDMAQSRLKAAVEGYAGWFSQRSVDENLLHKIHQHDSNLVSLVDQMDAAIQAWDGKDQPPEELSGAIELLHARIDRRNELLQRGS